MPASTPSPTIGRKTWAIAEGYIPGWSNGPAPELISHEAFCILNANREDAHVTLTVFFADRDPAGPYKFTIGARRTKHYRFNNLTEPESIPHGTSYASVFESDLPVVIQHTRLDSRQAQNTIMTTMAFPGAE
jgi:hypothetical protein